jgi:hypothetical protein
MSKVSASVTITVPKKQLSLNFLYNSAFCCILLAALFGLYNLFFFMVTEVKTNLIFLIAGGAKLFELAFKDGHDTPSGVAAVVNSLVREQWLCQRILNGFCFLSQKMTTNTSIPDLLRVLKDYRKIIFYRLESNVEENIIVIM